MWSLSQGINKAQGCARYLVHTGLVFGVLWKTGSPHLDPHPCAQVSLPPSVLRTGGHGQWLRAAIFLCSLGTVGVTTVPPCPGVFSRGVTPRQERTPNMHGLCSRPCHPLGSMGSDHLDLLHLPVTPLQSSCSSCARGLASASGPLHLLPPPPGLVFLQVSLGA